VFNFTIQYRWLDHPFLIDLFSWVSNESHQFRLLLIALKGERLFWTSHFIHLVLKLSRKWNSGFFLKLWVSQMCFELGYKVSCDPDHEPSYSSELFRILQIQWSQSSFREQVLLRFFKVLGSVQLLAWLLTRLLTLLRRVSRHPSEILTQFSIYSGNVSKEFFQSIQVSEFVWNVLGFWVSLEILSGCFGDSFMSVWVCRSI